MDERTSNWNRHAIKSVSDQTNSEIENLKKEVETLRQQLIKLSNSPQNKLSLTEIQHWYDGVNTPLNSLGKDEDYYLQVDNCDIYKKVLGNWERIGNLKGKEGLSGAQGPQGESGVNGLDGINGLDGVNGINGLNGATWYDGIGEPSPELGNNKDYFLDVYNGDIYAKDGSWHRIGNFVPSVNHVDDVIASKLELLQTQVNGLESGVNNTIASAGNSVTEMDGRVNTSIQTMNTTIENKAVELEDRVELSRATIRTEMNTIQTEHGQIVEEIAPTQQDIDDIIGMITI